MYKKCACCGKEFYMTYEMDPVNYVYKKKENSGVLWYCSYKCFKQKPKRKFRRAFN